MTYFNLPPPVINYLQVLLAILPHICMYSIVYRYDG